jgi:hypothetical protein
MTDPHLVNERMRQTIHAGIIALCDSHGLAAFQFSRRAEGNRPPARRRRGNAGYPRSTYPGRGRRRPSSIRLTLARLKPNFWPLSICVAFESACTGSITAASVELGALIERRQIPESTP